MEALVQQGFQILAEAGDGLVPRRLLLQQPGAFQVQPPHCKQQHDRREGEHAEKQNQHGVIAGHAAVDLRGLVPDAALRRGAQRGKTAEVGPAEAKEKRKVQRLKGQVQKPLDDLPIAQAARAHHQRGQARPGVSAPEDAGGAFDLALHVSPSPCSRAAPSVEQPFWRLTAP